MLVGVTRDRVDIMSSQLICRRDRRAKYKLLGSFVTPWQRIISRLA